LFNKELTGTHEWQNKGTTEWNIVYEDQTYRVTEMVELNLGMI